MEHEELVRRAEDLLARSTKYWEVTSTAFLTPAEQAAVQPFLAARRDTPWVLSGGIPDCERRVLFFLPEDMQTEEFDPEGRICAVRITAGFGTPGHRDYLGAVLGLGIRREWVGDILVQGDTAYLFCLPSVCEHLTASLEKVGRWGVKTQKLPLSEVPVPEKLRRSVSFTVQSVRLDAVLSGMFRISRTAAAEAIRQGQVSRNYLEELRPDAPVHEGDILSLRGYGKGELTSLGGTSRKGRQFLTADIYQ